MNAAMENDVAVRSRNVSLVDMLDRILGKGVVVDGDVQICVAGIELLYLKLNLLLASTATIEKFTTPAGNVECENNKKLASEAPIPPLAAQGSMEITPTQTLPPRGGGMGEGDSTKRGFTNENNQTEKTLEARVLGDDEPVPCMGKEPLNKINVDPKKVEQGLAKLVLTIVELLRKLMEKQALRRMEQNTLTDKEIDAVGEAFMQIDIKMQELKKVFGLKDGDLNLDLGPLGDLL